MPTTADSFLAHYGVKGMKWGVRKDEPTVLATKSLKNGNVLEMVRDPTPPIARALSIIPAYRKALDNTVNITLKDKNGKSIGDATLFKESPTSMNMMWIGVKTSERGKGYASAAVEAAISFAKSQDMTKMTLEVPGNSPDARHIYEKYGFTSVDKISSDGDVWGGLTSMELDLKK